ncbi:GNAT family N-acetyltransferase [Flavihumibacter sp. CACIAM 22H1]|uniref:GNAT family N-acetyltransferase n=1 Tax=Flavihumibacter sp. CACIAM 22H1 TaxID=1812911 RepID=UPI0007A802E7|nr:GNAT family N-acetyltransferase [Flavihumibacter sp. CACIAM 22H1]KYP15971.1 MAG: hypothetical protein A1D16_06835 [Flavihumibacter sp. CACIAM 22H1]
MAEFPDSYTNWKQAKLVAPRIQLIPLEEIDFDKIYQLAANPLVWSQHPNKNRYLLHEFETYFKGAIESRGAYKIQQLDTGKWMGCTRYYDFDPIGKSILIGYTFLGLDYWQQGYNQELKKCMVEHAFKYVNKILFHIGATNFRSQKSIEAFGAVKIGEIDQAYYGEPVKPNFIYEIKNPIQR